MNIVPLFIEGLTVHWGVLQQLGHIGARPPVLNKIRKAHREERVLFGESSPVLEEDVWVCYQGAGPGQ